MLLEALDLSKVKPIRDMAYDIIRQAICDGDLRPGDRLVESEMAEKMSRRAEINDGRLVELT